MNENEKANQLIQGMVVEDAVPGIPPHSGKFLNDGGLKLPERPFTPEEIEAARATTGSAEEAEREFRERSK